MEKNDFWGQFLQYAQISLTCFFRYFRNILSPLTWLQKVQAIWESQIFNLSEKMLTCKRQRGLSGSVQWWDSSTSLGILFHLPVPFYYRGSSHHLQMTCPEVFHHNFTQVSEKNVRLQGAARFEWVSQWVRRFHRKTVEDDIIHCETRLRTTTHCYTLANVSCCEVY